MEKLAWLKVKRFVSTKKDSLIFDYDTDEENAKKIKIFVQKLKHAMQIYEDISMTDFWVLTKEKTINCIKKLDKSLILGIPNSKENLDFVTEFAEKLHNFILTNQTNTETCFHDKNPRIVLSKSRLVLAISFKKFFWYF